MARHGIKPDTPESIYKFLKRGTSQYKEEVHCPMIIRTILLKPRQSAFCAEALICAHTFQIWKKKYPLFDQCYRLAIILAKEIWEKERDDSIGDPDFDEKAWRKKGSSLFHEPKEKIILEIESDASPWEQYQQILQQASHGDFSASEIKQIMEAVNVGRAVYETYKIQQEVDKMKKDLTEMGQNNADDTISISKATAGDTDPI